MRANVADRCGTPEADKELTDYRQRFGRIVQSGFHYHYARLIEAMYALERMRELLDDPAILSPKVRATAGVNSPEGVGIIEAPRGTLIHHYKVNDDGAMVWANLIVATGHNKGRRAGRQALRQRAQARGGRPQPGLGPGARLRPLPELLHPRPGHGPGEADPGRRRRRAPGREGDGLIVRIDDIGLMVQGVTTLGFTH